MSDGLRRILGRLWRGAGWAALGGVCLWSVPAILYSNLWAWLRPVVLLAFLAGVVATAWRLAPGRRRALALGGLCAGLIAWWFTIPASNDRDWQADVAVAPTADVVGNRVTVRGIRNFAYRTTSDFDVHWDERTYELDKLRSLDFYVSYWAGPSICHTMLSFGFEGDRYLCLSVEARKEKTEAYSAVKGFFRQYELVYVLADERDLVKLRTNVRKEQVYLYRLATSPEEVRGVFLDTLAEMNALARRPQWYNALMHNCTSNLRDRTAPYARDRRWSWKFVVNGYIDGLVYERGALDRSLPFEELKRRSHVNAKAQAAGDDPAFSRILREGLPGMAR
jgi:hypothetical protein